MHNSAKKPNKSKPAKKGKKEKHSDSESDEDMEDDDFSDDFDSEDEDDLELEDEWDTPSESEEGELKKKKGKKTDQKRNLPVVSNNPTARGRVTRSSGIVENTERNGRKSKNEKSIENEEVKLLLKP